MLEALSLLLVLAHTVESQDLTGPYCARVDKCCPGRLDECSVPILGTICYCDTFCNRTSRPDCCPDYHIHCLGDREQGYDRYQPLERRPEWTQQPPMPLKEGCLFNGRNYPVREKIRSNCNDCQCILMPGKAEMLCSREKCLLDVEVLDLLNRGTTSASQANLLDNDTNVRTDPVQAAARKPRWTAGNYSEFWGRSLEDGLSLRLGTLAPSDTVMKMSPLRHVLEPATLPRSFDARSNWPGLVYGVQDQGWCGASWAISTAAVASDRFAIMSMGKETPRLAVQHLLDCNNHKQHGCRGGHLDRAWYFTRKFGLVPDSCYPWTGQADQCHVPKKKATLQTARCPLRSLRSMRAKTELYRMGPAYRLGTEQDIMREIMRSGPVQATMQVYHDLFAYRSGIYEHLPVAELERTGYHSVRIVGWGEEDGVNFWIVANSWGEWWGEEGFFRIRRGTNECRIEELVLAAWAHTHVQKELDNTIMM